MEAEVLNISPALVWVVAGSQMLTFGLTLWNLIASGSRANAKTLERHGETLSVLDKRLSTVENTMRAIPKSGDFHDLDKKLVHLDGTMKVLLERLRPVEAISERLQLMLIEQGKR